MEKEAKTGRVGGNKKLLKFITKTPEKITENEDETFAHLRNSKALSYCIDSHLFTLRFYSMASK